MRRVELAPPDRLEVDTRALVAGIELDGAREHVFRVFPSRRLPQRTALRCH